MVSAHARRDRATTAPLVTVVPPGTWVTGSGPQPAPTAETALFTRPSPCSHVHTPLVFWGSPAGEGPGARGAEPPSPTTCGHWAQPAESERSQPTSSSRLGPEGFLSVKTLSCGLKVAPVRGEKGNTSTSHGRFPSCGLLCVFLPRRLSTTKARLHGFFAPRRERTDTQQFLGPGIRAGSHGRAETECGKPFGVRGEKYGQNRRMFAFLSQTHPVLEGGWQRQRPAGGLGSRVCTTCRNAKPSRVHQQHTNHTRTSGRTQAVWHTVPEREAFMRFRALTPEVQVKPSLQKRSL